jgi:hypothetical protein
LYIKYKIIIHIKSVSKEEVNKAIQFSRLTSKQCNRIENIINEHYMKSNIPFPMRKIANLPFGKEALLSGNLDGILDLTSKPERKYFEKYLGF